MADRYQAKLEPTSAVALGSIHHEDAGALPSIYQRDLRLGKDMGREVFYLSHVLIVPHQVWRVRVITIPLPMQDLRASGTD